MNNLERNIVFLGSKYELVRIRAWENGNVTTSVVRDTV